MNTLHVTHLSLNYKTKSCNNLNATPSRANNITFVRFSFNLIYISIDLQRFRNALIENRKTWYIYYTKIHSFINVADGQRFSSNNICACKRARSRAEQVFFSFSSSDLKNKIYMHVYLDKCSQLKIKIHVYHMFLFCFENIYSPLSCLLLYK